MKQAYLDCSSGISGDMFLAALLDAGLPFERLFGELKKLPLGFYEFKRLRVLRSGLLGTRIEVRVRGDQPHRKLADIEVLLETAKLPEKALRRALKAFQRLAEVEGKLHNLPPEEIHFHEVGAVDAVLDIVGACVGLELLEISDLVCSPLNVGGGRVDAAHGSLPVPAPATAELLKNIPVYSSGVEGELVTPTGAVLVSTLASGFGPLPPMKIAKIGYGAGENEYHGHPNLARLFVGEPSDVIAAQPGLPGDEMVSLIEATVQNMDFQAYGQFVEQAVAAGAMDVTCSLAHTKKNRPGLTISVLCEPAKTDALSQLLFQHTPASGVRILDARRKSRVGEQGIEEVPTGDEAVGKGGILSQLLVEPAAAMGAPSEGARSNIRIGERDTPEAPAGSEAVCVIEATVYDPGAQRYAQFLQKALAAGALDVTRSPAQMKQNRAGLTISMVSAPDKAEDLSRLLFEQTAATGIRVHPAWQKVQKREPEAEAPSSGDEIISVIEANVDDMSPQLYGYFLEQALAAGALDVTCCSAQMKKNRPGLTITLLCEPGKSDALCQLLFEQTTTIGVRIYEARRKVLAREHVTVITPYGAVKVKVARREGKVVNAAPEFDDCQRLAAAKSVPLKKVIAAAEAAYLEQRGKADAA
jgi:hypothetical protein